MPGQGPERGATGSRRGWALSAGVAAVATAVSAWLWFGPWLWTGIPWLVIAVLPFTVALLAPRAPLLFAAVPFLVPYVLEGAVEPMRLLYGLGACYIAAAVAILLRRLIGGMLA